MSTEVVPDLSRFDGEFKPVRGTKLDLSVMPDGEYDFTVLEAGVSSISKGTENVIRLAIQVDTEGNYKGAIAEKLYFLRSQENVDALGADLLTLGFDTDKWTAKHGKKFSEELPKALRRMRGLRFKAMKKNSNPNAQGKSYGNLYLKNRVGEMPPEGGLTVKNPNAPF